MAGPSKKRPSTDELLRRWEADKKSRIFLKLADEYRRQDFIDAALSVLREGLKHHPNFAPAHVALARCYMARHELTEAQAELERLHAKDPQNMLAGKLLGEVLVERGERARALQVLRSLLPFAFDDPEVEERVKTLEEQVKPPRLTRLGGGSGDTEDFGTSEFATDGGDTAGMSHLAGGPDAAAGVPSASAESAEEGEPILFDAESFADEPELPDELPAAPESQGAADQEESPAAETGPFGAARAQAADEVSPFDRTLPLGQMGDGSGALEDLLGQGAPAEVAPAAAGEDDDLTSLTLAELYEAQDSPDEAAAIYARLLDRKPGDGDLRAALERCRARAAATDLHGEAAAPAVPGSASFDEPEARAEADPFQQSEPLAEPEPVAGPRSAPTAPKLVAATELARPPEGTEDAAGEDPSPEALAAILAEYDRWLAAVRELRA